MGVCVIKNLLNVNDHELNIRSVNRAVYFLQSRTAVGVDTAEAQSWT